MLSNRHCVKCRGLIVAAATDPEPTVCDCCACGHILQDRYLGCGDMRGGYARAGVLPTSTVGDVFLIRSHIAYWSGTITAQYAKITPSRGHSYRVVTRCGETRIVHITDHYDHRAGVSGFTESVCPASLFTVQS